MKRRILCIEDDLTTQTVIELALSEFEVVVADTLKKAEILLRELDFVAWLVDIRLPDGDGLRFLTRMVKDERIKNIPILVLSNQCEVANKVAAFSFGVDDFIGKPFDPIELHARVSAKVRRREVEADEARTRKLGDLLLDLGRQKVFHVSDGSEKDLGLTAIELKILATLTRRLERTYSREQLIAEVWRETSISDRTVDSHIAHLRQKIQETAVAVETAKSFGYRAVLKV